MDAISTFERELDRRLIRAARRAADFEGVSVAVYLNRALGKAVMASQMQERKRRSSKPDDDRISSEVERYLAEVDAQRHSGRPHGPSPFDDDLAPTRWSD